MNDYNMENYEANLQQEDGSSCDPSEQLSQYIGEPLPGKPIVDQNKINELLGTLTIEQSSFGPGGCCPPPGYPEIPGLPGRIEFPQTGKLPTDVINTLPDIFERAQKRNEQTKNEALTKLEIAAIAKEVADRLNRSESFEKDWMDLREILKKADSSGQMKDMIKQINDELKRKGSDLSLTYASKTDALKGDSTTVRLNKSGKEVDDFTFHSPGIPGHLRPVIIDEFPLPRRLPPFETDGKLIIPVPIESGEPSRKKS